MAAASLVFAARCGECTRIDNVPDSDPQRQPPADGTDPLAANGAGAAEGYGQLAGDDEDTLVVVTVCSMADGTLEVTVKRDALVDDLVDAIAQSRGITNPRRIVVIHVAGEAEPLADTQSVAARMADAGVSVSELFMLLRASDDRRVLEEIYNYCGGGANWDPDGCAGWMTVDAPLSEWYGVTADADDNVTALALYDNQITDEGMVALAAALPGWQVRVLLLNDNQITDAGAAALAQALPRSQVTTLDLQRNPITGPMFQLVLAAASHANLAVALCTRQC